MHRILIAEDDQSFRTLIKAYLEKYADRFETIVVEDGLEAIKILQHGKISLLITDLKMPKVEGLVLLAYMNKNFPKIPCIVITSLERPRLKEKLKKDVLHYIEKPFRAEDLARSVMAALDQNAMEGDLYGISIASFLQLIKMDRKTCVCEVESPDRSKGSFHFKNGILHNAFYGDLQGESAALEMIQIDHATIAFKNLPEDTIERRIKKDLTALILEALRLKDESADGEN